MRSCHLALLIAAVAATFMTGCELLGFDQGEGSYEGRRNQSLADSQRPPLTTAANDGGVADATSTSSPTATAQALDVFANAEPFRIIPPLKESAAMHEGSSNKGKDCLSCHNGSTIAPKFLLAGSMIDSSGSASSPQTPSNTDPFGDDDDDRLDAPQAQVRIIDGNTGAVLALFGTDSVGNFWLEPTGSLPSLPKAARIGVRTQKNQRAMTMPIPNGSCNQSNCHVGEKAIDLGAGLKK